jgi:plasmid replication initiation protein
MEITKIKNNLVVSSNDLVHAKYDLSLWQKRVFVYSISQLEKEDKDFEPIKMNVSDIIKFFKGSDGAKTYNAILEAPKNLDKTIEIPYVTEKGFLRYGFIKLLQKYTIPADDQEENQYIELCFNNDLRPHLLDLKEKFLKYDIRNVIELQSTYSFRMFEILKSYEYRKTIELDIDYLRKILEVTTKYKSYKDFRIYIIDKAQQDLKAYCDISFTYEERKAAKGKKIESLIFHIFTNEPQERDTKGTSNRMKKEKSTGQKASFLFEEPNEFEKKEKSTVKKGGSLFKESVEFEKREKSTVEKGFASFEAQSIFTEKEKSTAKNTVSSLDTNDGFEKKEKSTAQIKATKERKEAIEVEKLVMELSPIVVSQFGVSLKVFMGLAELHTEGEIRQAIQVTQKTQQLGKVVNIAGFFVEAVRGKYTDPKQKKMQAEVEQQTKRADIDRVEEAAKNKVKDDKKAIYAQEMSLFKQLIEEDKSLIDVLISKVNTGMLGTYYKSDLSFDENLKHPLLQAAFLSAVKEMLPQKFELK